MIWSHFRADVLLVSILGPSCLQRSSAPLSKKELKTHYATVQEIMCHLMEIYVIIANAQMILINAHTDLSRGARDRCFEKLNIGTAKYQTNPFDMLCAMIIKYLSGICLCSILISLSNVSNLLQNYLFPIFSLFWRPFSLP